MKKKRDPFAKMYEELHDPIRRAEARRKNEIKKQLKDKKDDTGL